MDLKANTKLNNREYEKITIDYPLSFARAITKDHAPKPFNFVYVSGEGATTTPGHLTAFFGIIKGRAEAALLDLSKEKEYANLRPFSLRPAGVDPTLHKEVHDFLPQRKGIMRFVSMQGVLGSVIRGVAPSMVSPTKDLARVLTDLAMGDGAKLEGKGVDGEGRTISNVGMRRLAGLDC